VHTHGESASARENGPGVAHRRVFGTCLTAFFLAAPYQPMQAESRGWAVSTADIVVVGKLQLSSYFLFFEGVRVNGNIVPTEVLYGNLRTGAALRFQYVYPCSVWDQFSPNRPNVACDYRAVWQYWSLAKERFTQDGVWPLWRWTDASWTERQGLVGAYPLQFREYAIRVLSGRKAPPPDH
jgi:hypothetical protein